MTTRYRRHGRDATEDEALDEDGILRDGFSVTVPMTMRDSLQRSIAASHLHDGRITDADGGTLGLHRPGARYAARGSFDDAREEAYRLYDEEVANAWRQPAGTYPRNANEGEPGHPEARGGGLAPVVTDAREQAYRDYDAAVANAWRGPPDSGKW